MTTGSAREAEAAKDSDAAADVPSAHTAKMPTELASFVVQSSAELIAALIIEHPQLRDPIFATIQQVRGNAFAQTVIATATRNKPTPDGDATPQPAPSTQPTATAGPVADPAASRIIERQKIAAWDQMSRGPIDERYAPSVVRLPDAVVAQIDQAWKDSLATNPELEQGGNLVRTYGGKYKLRRGATDDAGSFQAEPNDIGWGESYVAVVHTHPYRDEEKAGTWVSDYGSFSTADLWEIVNDQQPLNILRSGPFTFMIARTKQFDALVTKHEAAGTLNDLIMAITETSNASYKTARGGGLSQKDSVEHAVLDVCRAFHLVYYEGQGNELHRATSGNVSA